MAILSLKPSGKGKLLLVWFGLVYQQDSSYGIIYEQTVAVTE